MAYNTEAERNSTFPWDLTVAFKKKAGGTIGAHRLGLLASDGDVEVGTAGSTAICGVLHSNYNGLLSAVSGDTISVGVGRQTCVADGVITVNQSLKCASGGRVIQLVDSALAGTTIEDNVGLGFTNQPANDGLEVLSSSASDTTQTVTAWYTRTGQGNTVYTETKTLNGTSVVSFTHTDVALVLAVEKSAATVGTITFREASADQTVTTLAAGTLSAGKIAVTAGQTKAYNVAPTAVVDAASTKTLGLIGTAADGTALLDSAALTGATAVTMNSAFNAVTYLLVGDLETARTVTVKVGAEEATNVYIGWAMESAAAQDQLIDVWVDPRRLSASATAQNLRTGQEYLVGGSPKVGSAAGWTVNAAADLFQATCAASQTGAKLVVPLIGLKTGWIITGFRPVFQVESAGNTVTVDTDLRYQANAAADPTDNSIGTATQVSVTADTASGVLKGGLSHTVSTSNSYYALITATTAASTDIRFLSLWVTVTEV